MDFPNLPPSPPPPPVKVYFTKGAPWETPEQEWGAVLFFSQGRPASPPPPDNARFEARWPAGSGRPGHWAASLRGARSWKGGRGRRAGSRAGEAGCAGRKTVEAQFSAPLPSTVRPAGPGAWAAGKGDVRDFALACFLRPRPSPPTQTFYFNTEFCLLDCPAP